MLRKLIQISEKSSINLKILNSLRNISTTSVNQFVSINNNNKSPKWDLYASVLVERLPLCSKTLTEQERNYQQLLYQLEFENSLKSNHEIKIEDDIRQAELVKRGEIKLDLDDFSSQQTAQDAKDAYVDEYNKFKFASRITEGDEKNDLRTTDRKLEETLYLLIEQKLGDKNHLILPQGKRFDGETMRQTAERILREKCGSKIDVQFYGNAPCGFFKYKYPAAERLETDGAKIFFYRCSLKTGTVDESLSGKFEWLDKRGLENKIHGDYAKSVQQFLIY